MSCGPEMELRLSRYVDNELPAEERLQVDEHVAGCAPCRELLSLFQRNERLVSQALATETFGEVVIDSVTRSLKGETAPPEAKVVEETLWERLRQRPWIPTAAAALMFLALSIALLVRQADLGRSVGGLEATLEETRKQQEKSAAEQRDREQANGERLAFYEAEIRELTARAFIRDAGYGYMAAYIQPDHGIRVMASFDRKAYRSYHVFRRLESESEDRYAQLNKDPLPEPVFTDEKAQPGQGYYYKFRAMRENSDQWDESAPLFLSRPFPENVEQCIKVHCDKTAAPGHMAVFVLERVVGGKRVSEKFDVKVGERVGGLRGKVDFATDLVLDKIEEGNQVMSLRFTAPIWDQTTGKPAMTQLKNGKLIPATRTEEVPVAIGGRKNTRVVFRTVGRLEGHRIEPLWQGSWMWVRQAD